MATGRRQVAPGQVIASDWGNVVWDQSVQQFATAADRTTQYPAPKLGAVSWLDDVKALQVWNGSAWLGVADERAARGQLGQWVGVAASGTAGGSPAPVGGAEVIVTAVAGRRYRALLHCHLQQTAANTITRAYIYMDGAGIATALASMNTNTYMAVATAWTGTLTAGPHTFQVWVSSDTGGANIYASPAAPATLLIEDVGRQY